MTSLLSVNVGLPRDVPWRGRTVHTGVWKYPVSGPLMARQLNIDGDGQGDLSGHGGEQRAVLVYQAESLRYWGRHFGRDDIGHGQFGENLTVDGLADDEVCIGDRYRIGEAEFEVTQPRVTCFRVGMRMGEPELPALMVSHHRPGFYMRVIREGLIQAGDQVVRSVSGPGGLTVADTDALLYLPGKDPARLRAALDIPALSPGWQASFRDLLTAATAGQPAWTGFRPLRVMRVVPETASVTSIYLTGADGGPLPAVPAGEYLTLRIPGAGSPPPVRSYSLSAAVSRDDGYRISVKRESHGTASGYLTTALRPGAVLDAGAPRGEFVLDSGRSPLVLLSAGIGVTPVLAMLHELAGARSERQVWWIHTSRRPDEYPMGSEAHELLASLPDAREHVFYSATSGRLDNARLTALGIPADATAYICGPESFMADMRDALTGLGIAADRIRTELFGALAPITPGIAAQPGPRPHQPPGPAGTGPLVTFARSGISAPFSSGVGSVLEFAESCDVPTRWACRTGVCHTCVTPLVSGSLAYSPDPLEPPPDGQALICCSRPSTDVVLDM